MSRVVFLFEHGINALPSDWRDWTNRAIFHVHDQTPYHAQSLEYFAGPIVAHFRHRHLADGFAKLVCRYAGNGWKIVVVAHSNGARIVVEGLRRARWPRVEELHLVCGAVDANFERNGLNAALYDRKIGSAHVYVAGLDRAMQIEDTLLGRQLFGIRSEPLGLFGPLHVRPSLAGRVHVVRRSPWDEYGHSDCWRARNFERTMDCFTRLTTAP